MIIASIAMEELALSHILNAEGEKLQYILGTLPGTSPCACPHDVLAVNKSVTALVEAVTQNQMLLKNKLAQVLEFCPLPSPPPPACKPEPGPTPCPSPCRPDPCVSQCPVSSPPPPPSSHQVLSCEKKRCSINRTAGENAVESGLSPVLETAKPFRKKISVWTNVPLLRFSLIQGKPTQSNTH